MLAFGLYTRMCVCVGGGGGGGGEGRGKGEAISMFHGETPNYNYIH